MGLLGFLKFALKCSNVLAWPMFALCYPLWASIQAIETNSNYDMLKLITYWVLFSLISLFELAFFKLIEWVPLWPYIKLIAICWLVVPHFNGAYYVYKSLVHRCLSLDLQVVICQLNKPKAELALKSETFLAVAERYVQENGSEALEKLIARKSTDAEPNLDVEVIKAVANTEERELGRVIQSDCEELNFAQKNTKEVELTDNNAAAAAKTVKGVNANLQEREKKTGAAMEVKEMSVPESGSVDNVIREIPDSKKVQKEWTCAVCQVTTTSEKTLNCHRQGKKHMAKCEELKARKQTSKSKGSSSSSTSNKSDQANQNPKKYVSGDGPKVHVNVNSAQCKQKKPKNADTGTTQSKYWCRICDLKCTGEIDMASHLMGRKHLSRINA